MSYRFVPSVYRLRALVCRLKITRLSRIYSNDVVVDAGYCLDAPSVIPAGGAFYCHSVERGADLSVQR
jgi:hypothetical protein